MRRLSFCLILFLASCAHAPRETAMLSAHVGGEIAEARRMHSEAIDLLFEQSRARVDERLYFQWTPNYIKGFLKSRKAEKNFCKAKGVMDKVFEMRDIVDKISNAVESMRRQKYDEVVEVETEMRIELRNHYDNLQRHQGSVTAQIQAVSESLDFEKEIRKTLGKSLDKIEPIRKLKKKLEGIIDMEMPFQEEDD